MLLSRTKSAKAQTTFPRYLSHSGPQLIATLKPIALNVLMFLKLSLALALCKIASCEIVNILPAASVENVVGCGLTTSHDLPTTTGDGFLEVFKDTPCTPVDNFKGIFLGVSSRCAQCSIFRYVSTQGAWPIAEL